MCTRYVRTFKSFVASRPEIKSRTLKFYFRQRSYTQRQRGRQKRVQKNGVKVSDEETKQEHREVKKKKKMKKGIQSGKCLESYAV